MESYQVFNGLFKLFSSTSVNNPFEVIIILISICISLSILSSSSSSHFNPSPTTTANSPLRFVEITINSNPIDNPMSYFNYSFLMFLRCLAFIFLVFQFKSLKKVHSKFILTLTVSTTLISSIIFNNALIKWFDFEIPNNLLLIIDMLIYTLVLIDPKKCNQLLNRSLDTKCVKEAKGELAQYFAQHAANSCLDTLSLVLLFSLGNLSDSREIRNFAQFSCLLIISNFFIFFTIYPALLSLVLQFKSKGKHEESSIEKKRVDDNRTAGLVLSSLTNPIVVYIKVLMTLFLVLIHLKLKFFNAKNLNSHENVKNRTKEASLSNVEQLSASELQEETIFYAECCLLITLLIYICTKFAKLEEIDETNVYISLSQTPSTNDGSTQTEPEINKIPTIKVEESVLAPKEAQTHQSRSVRNDSETIRPMLECINIMKNTPGQRLDELTDAEVIELVKCKQVPIYKLESHFSDAVRAIELRRRIVSGKMPSGVAECFEKLPYEAYDYAKVAGSCCENVIGYVPIPLGVAGPLKIDGALYHIPMATTEGTLVASTNRGCTALSSGQGVFTRVLSDGMSRGPVLEFSSAMRAAEVKEWLDWEENFIEIKRAFDTTSRFAKLESTKCCVVGKYLYIRFVARTGDAMGMNMLSKGSEKALAELQKHFPDAQIKSVSGNYCSDKKATAINWIEGRGKSVVCEATIKGEVVRNVLKTSVKALVDLNLTKNLVGSAMAGSIGGFNAHAANIVAALFIACGQDPAQVVESSNCLTWMECVGPNNEDLYISCTMPSLEVGTVGGGTFLDAQSSCLKILGVFGPNEQNPGENACKLARIIASAVLAGELSLMSALASGHLVNSHMKYNRSTISMKSLDGPTNNNNNNNAHNLL